MIRTIAVILLVVITLATVVVLASGTADETSTGIRDYYLSEYEADTSAENAVAAIYLNYRVYDTIFEALLLLIAIIATVHFFQIGGKR
jgi:multisubunit Na+/H+ antiporter MnhB subunit